MLQQVHSNEEAESKNSRLDFNVMSRTLMCWLSVSSNETDHYRTK